MTVTLVVDGAVVLVGVVGRRQEDQVGLHLVADPDHGVEEALAVAREVADLEVEAAHALLRDAELRGGVEQLLAEHVRRELRGDGLLGGRERDVYKRNSRMLLQQPPGGRPPCSDQTDIGRHRDGEHSQCQGE